jgi:hypothetical protein
MALSSSAQGIRSFVYKEYIEPARRKGELRIKVVAGDVHRALKLKNRVPNVCQVLDSRKFCEENRLEIEEKSGPPSGMGTRMVYVYRLVDYDRPSRATPPAASFDQLKGLLKEALQSLGGGEAFLRNERSRFYGSGEAERK